MDVGRPDSRGSVSSTLVSGGQVFAMSRRWGVLLALLFASVLAAPAMAVEPPPAQVLEWGGYGSALGRMSNPYKPAIGPDGLIYVPELTNSRVQVFDREGRSIRTMGSYGDGPGQLNSPTEVAVSPNGDIYVVDESNDRIQVFSQNGTFLRSLGGATWGPFHLPNVDGIAFDDSGFVYVAEESQVRRFTSSGVFAGYWKVGLPNGAGSLELDVERDFVYLLASGRVYKYAMNGDDLAEWQVPYGTVAASTTDMAVAPDGTIYVTNEFGNVFRFSAGGSLITSWGPGANISLPSGIEVDQVGDIYIVEGLWKGTPRLVGSHTISKWSYSPTPTLKTTWGRIKAMYR